MKILHIEPDSDYHLSLAESLRSEGYQIIRAGTACEALETLLDKNVPDLVVCNTSLPDVSGITLLQNIRGVKGLACSDLPFIMTYNQMGGEEWMQAMRMDVHHFIPKYCEPNVLSTAIREALQPSGNSGLPLSSTRTVH